MSEALSILTKRGTRLAAVLDGAPSKRLAISCHGMMSNKDGDKHRALSELLLARGLPCVRFDFTGCGASEGDIAGMTFSREVEDLDAVIDFFAARGVERFGLFGSSMGGAVAYLGAAHDERVVTVATLAAVGDTTDIEARHPTAYEAWTTQGFYVEDGRRIDKTFLEDALGHDIVRAVSILRIPILVIHGELDLVVPVSDAHDIATAARHATLNLVPGADHRFTDLVHQRPAMQQIADFLAQNT